MVPTIWSQLLEVLHHFRHCVCCRENRPHYKQSINALVEFTNMDKVTRLALGKESIPEYKEGMFAFINCPEVSKYEWHPFTISSAPQEPYITFHLRIQGKGSWTRGVKEYLDVIAGGKVFTELYHHDPKKGRIRGMHLGPTANLSSNL